MYFSHNACILQLSQLSCHFESDSLSEGKSKVIGELFLLQMFHCSFKCSSCHFAWDVNLVFKWHKSEFIPLLLSSSWRWRMLFLEATFKFNLKFRFKIGENCSRWLNRGEHFYKVKENSVVNSPSFNLHAFTYHQLSCMTSSKYTLRLFFETLAEVSSSLKWFTVLCDVYDVLTASKFTFQLLFIVGRQITSRINKARSSIGMDSHASLFCLWSSWSLF